MLLCFRTYALYSTFFTFSLCTLYFFSGEFHSLLPRARPRPITRSSHLTSEILAASLCPFINHDLTNSLNTWWIFLHLQKRPIVTARSTTITIWKHNAVGIIHVAVNSLLFINSGFEFLLLNEIATSRPVISIVSNIHDRAIRYNCNRYTTSSNNDNSN